MIRKYALTNIITHKEQNCLTLFRITPIFYDPERKQYTSKILLEKDKMLGTSILSFSNNDFDLL